MKIKVEDSHDTTTRHVQIQISTNGKWIDFGFMNYKEREELATQLRGMANELTKTGR